MKVSLNLDERELNIIQKVKDYYDQKGIKLDTTGAITYCINTTDAFDPEINKLTDK